MAYEKLQFGAQREAAVDEIVACGRGTSYESLNCLAQNVGISRAFIHVADVSELAYGD